MVLSPLLAFLLPGQEPITPEVLYQRVLPSVVTLSVERADGTKATGTGFLALRDGCAVTAFHVVRQAKKVTARFSSGEEFDVSGWIDSDAKRDIALIKVKVADRPLLEFTVAEPAVGSKAFVVGSPRGLDFSISDGLIGQIRQVEGVKQYQFTCPASPGNSGGPLIAADGTVLGVVSWQRVDGQNLNFAVPNAFVRGLDHSLPTKPWDTGEVATAGAPGRDTGAPKLQVLSDALQSLHRASIPLQLFAGAAKSDYRRGLLLEQLGRVEQSRRLLKLIPDEADPSQLGPELALIFGDTIKAVAVLNRIAAKQEFSHHVKEVIGPFNGAYRACEVSPRFIEELETPEYAAFKAAIPRLIYTKLVANPIQKGWIPPEGRFKNGLTLLSRLAQDVDRTGYTFGFLVSADNPALLEECNSGTPPRRWGFAKGDVVKSVEGEPVGSFEEMKEKLLALGRPGQVTVQRKDREVTLKVDLRPYTK